MAEAAVTGQASRASRLDRRKARTRQALIDAAVRLIAEGREDRASIQEITDAADIGFGSFYNHFDTKDQLFQTASEEVLERWGQMIDRACAGMSDPAELSAVSLRISGRLGWTHPEIARFLTGAGLDVLDTPRGLAPRALRGHQGRSGRRAIHRGQRRDRAQRRRRRPARTPRAAPVASGTHRQGISRPACLSQPAHARRPCQRSGPHRRAGPAGH
jgi:AcrR family transcriptional regulator